MYNAFLTGKDYILYHDVQRKGENGMSYSLAEYLKLNNPDLLSRAIAQGIEIDTEKRLELFDQRPTLAIQDLQRAVILAETQDKHEALVQKFKDIYAKELKRAIDAHDALLEAKEDFENEHGIYLVIDYDLEDLVRIGRAPYGSKKPREKDLKTFGRRLDREGIPRQLRLSVSENHPYEYAEITKGGKIKAGEVIYNELREWHSAVRRKAFDAGIVDSLAGSPWKAVQIQRNRRQDWASIQSVYDDMMK